MKKGLSWLPLVLVPAVIVLAAAVGGTRWLLPAGYLAAVLALGSFFLTFEKKETDTIRLVILAVMTALSVGGRILFAAVPFFKPVSALTVLTAAWFGGEAGFAVGALSALLSGFYFGMGPWTPFQMVTWGLIGLAAGLLSVPLRKNRIVLSVYGGLAGIFFSLFMDGFMALWMEEETTLAGYLRLIGLSLPMTGIYVLSNVLFLLLLRKPVGNAFDRMITKYGMDGKEKG